MAECLITGCYLYNVTDARHCWGDLHEVGDCYVFNAVLFEGETFWESNNPFGKILNLRDGAPYFERRGVIIVPKSYAYLNSAGASYIQGSTK